MAISEERIEELRAKHGRIKHVTYNGHDLVFRKPKRVECQQHAMKQDDPTAKINSVDELAIALIVQVDDAVTDIDARKSFSALIEDYPFLTKNEKVAVALGKLAGVTEDEESKK